MRTRLIAGAGLLQHTNPTVPGHNLTLLIQHERMNTVAALLHTHISFGLCLLHLTYPCGPQCRLSLIFTHSEFLQGL